jgi:predicted nuclease of restriction endonuclease-like RecB superfamily
LVRRRSIIFAHEEQTVKNEIAETLGRCWSEIEGELFSDVYELQRLRKFEGYESEAAFLARYNEAQIQAALYSAIEMQVTAKRDYRPIVMAAKRAMLMHDAERLPDNSYRFTFYGPVSPLRTTKRYGVHLAQIIPRLLACRDWEMIAPIKFFRNGKQPELRISSSDKYRSSVAASPEFDSVLEKNFAEKWGNASRDGWALERESEARFAGQKAFFPDFTFVHESGRRVLMEIVGHWTPEYLKAKRETLLQFREEPILLAVGSGDADSFLETGAEIIRFKKALKIEPVKDALNRLLGDGGPIQ